MYIQISSTDDPEGLLKSCGWDAPTVSSLGDETAHYGRWPFRCVESYIQPLSFATLTLFIYIYLVS